MTEQSCVTLDTNVAIYALTKCEKSARASAVLAQAAFLSVQVLNEYVNVALRKFRREWVDIAGDVQLLSNATLQVMPITVETNREAQRLAARYKLAFYDALIIATAMSGGARLFYSEDMQHGLVIDDRLTIINPFLSMESENA